MKTNPFAYLNKAPKLKGYRVLRPSERIRRADRFSFLFAFNIGVPPNICICPPVSINSEAHFHVGGTLVDARKTFGPGFDGIVYRTSKK